MLNEVTLPAFLAEDWRKHPRVFRQAIDVTRYQVPAVSLCEMTADELVESRLIEPDYHVEHGPFEFIHNVGEPLLADGQMLMVQCLEQHSPTVARLVDEAFSFIPRWQIDDVMASYGYDGANCGAHFDHYDVFLVQLSGAKIWHLDQADHDEAELMPDLDLRLLPDIEVTDKLLLEPGDVLYIPPGRGHHGICQGESMTLSVGIRNPTTAELLAEVSEFALEYGEVSPLEAGLHATAVPLGQEIAMDLRHELSRIFDHNVLTRWYGCYVTRLRDPDILLPLAPDLASAPAISLSNMTISASLPTRLTWADTDVLLFFANGDSFELMPEDKAWVPQLCLERKVRLPEVLFDSTAMILQGLITCGALEHANSQKAG